MGRSLLSAWGSAAPHLLLRTRGRLGRGASNDVLPLDSSTFGRRRLCAVDSLKYELDAEFGHCFDRLLHAVWPCESPP